MYSLRHRLLTADEEIDLGMRVQAGKTAAARIKAGETEEALSQLVADGAAAQETLLRHNMRLVHKVAHKWTSSDPAMDFDDLVQEGVLGLLKSIDRWEWQRGYRFSTFAMWWIQQHISRSVANSGRIRVPIWTTEAHRNIRQEYVEARERALVVYELDAPVQDEDHRTLHEITPDDTADDVEDVAINRAIVEKAFRTPMPEKWRLVVRDWMDGYTYREAGDRHGLSRSIVQAAYRRMQEYLGVDMEGVGD